MRRNFHRVDKDFQSPIPKKTKSQTIIFDGFILIQDINMRFLSTIVPTLCVVVITSACNAAEEGPAVDTIRAGLEAEGARIIGAPGLISIKDVEIGKTFIGGNKRVIYSANFTAIAVVDGPLFKPEEAERFGENFLMTYSPSTPIGTEVPIFGEATYVQEGETWVVWRSPLMYPVTGGQFFSIGMSEQFFLSDGNYTLAGSPETEAKRRAIAAAETIFSDGPEAKTKPSETSREARDARLKAMAAERTRRNATGADAATP